MGLPDEKKDEKEDKKKKKEESELANLLDEEEMIPLKQDILRSGLDINIAPPSMLIRQESLRDSTAQMEISPIESVVYTPIPTKPSKPPKPRDPILVKADKLIIKARNLIKEYKYEAAMQQLTERINLLKKTNYKLQYAKTFLLGGHVLNIIRKNDEAKLLLEKGIKVLQQTDYKKSQVMGTLRLELGIALQKLAKYEQALEEFNKAGELYKSRGNNSDYMRSLWNKGILFYNTQNWKNAVEVYLEIARIYAEDPEAMTSRLKSLQRIADLIQMAKKMGEIDFNSASYIEEISLMKGEYEKALAHELRRATKGRSLEQIQAEQARDPANLALWHFNLAAAEITAPSGKISSAIEHYNKSIELYKEIGDKLGLSRCYQHMAYIKDKQGQSREAIKLLRQCIELREDLKETLSIEEYRTAIQAETIPIYDELSYLEAKLNNYKESLNAIEQSKSRELINHLANEELDTCPYVKNLLKEEEKALIKLRELEQKLFDFGMRYSEMVRQRGKIPQVAKDREELEQLISKLHIQLQDYRRNIWMKCIDSGNTKPPIQYDILSNVLETIKKETHWTILEFIWNPIRAQIMVYFITPNDIKLFETPLTSNELKNLLDQYKEALIDGDNKKLEDSSMKFSEKVIPSGIFAELERSANIQYLFIIPHKELHAIPFEIIQYNTHYWGQKYCIVKNFSLDLCRITLQKRMNFQQKDQRIKKTAIVVGNPTFDLPSSEVEAREVKHMLKQKDFKVKLMLKRKSKENIFVNEVKDKNIIHYAGHGIFITPEPILSHLSFTSSDLTAREITQLKLKNIPIVVLSACETAISGFLGGNELVGFVRSFILAGSTTIVTTNWPVHDESAQELICKYYEFLLTGASVGIALQKARQFIAQKYQNQIVHWAAYTLFGDPYRKLIGS